MSNKESKGKVVKAATWYTISNVALRAISIITAPIFTRLLTTSDYGIASNFNTWCTIVSCVTGLGLTTGIIRGKIEFKDDFKKYLASVQFLSIIFSGCIFLLSIPFLDKLSDWMVLDKFLVVFMFIYLLFQPSVSYAQINFRFEYKYRENILITVINSIGTVACSIALILMWTEYKYIGRCIGSIIPMIIIGIYFLMKILREGHCFYNKKYWKYALKISLPMIPHALAMQVLGQIDRIMIIRMCGESEAGIYSFGYSYAIMVALLTNALNEAIQPTLYEWLEEKEASKVEKLTTQICFGLIIVCVGLIGVGPEVLRILGTQDFFDGRWVVYPVVIGSLFQYMYQNYACVETYYKRTSIIAIGSVVAAVVNAALNAIFIPHFGYLAAGYTTMAGYLFLLIFHFWGARYVCKDKIFNGKITIVIILIAIVSGLLCNLLYLTPVVVRYAVLVLCIGLILLILKKRIINLLEGFMAMRGKKNG